MQEITPNTPQSLPVKLRGEHTPQTGDIYLYTGCQDKEIIRLGEKEVYSPSGAQHYTRFKTESWSFAEGAWKDGRRDVSLSDLKEYYKLCLVPFDELVKEADAFFRGDAACSDDAPVSDTEDLVSLGSRLPDMLSQAEMLEDRMQTLSLVYKARMEEQMRLMEEKMKPLKALAEQAKKQLLNIRRAISIVEIYQGQNVEVVTLCEGAPAGADVPVTVRQRILFMDEECAVLDEEGQGLDYWTRDRFYEWIKNPRHRDVILPEPKCVVVMKPRRNDKQYSRDAYEQARLNEWNKHSFVFIRNGENVSVIESDNLCIYGAVVPRKADYDRLAEEAEHWRDSAQRDLEDINYRCVHFAMVLQGLADRTDVFAPHAEINFVKNIGTQVVFDDEQDSLLGTGRPDFTVWLREQARTIRRGSRIIYVRGFSSGKPMRWELRGDFRWGHKVASPETGLYTVEEKDGGRLGFAYLPQDVFGERKRRETWLFDRETVINYDAVTLDVLKGYLEDRSQRQYYQGLIPLLRKYQLELEKEQGYEELFLSALTKVLDGKNISYTPETLQDALVWWKTKVIHVRPISSDDDKAWRMIIGRVKRG